MKRLILSSGGLKGIVFIGMLNGTLLSQFTEIIGTSAGALITFIISMGYSINEIENLLSQKKEILCSIFKIKVLKFTKTYGILDQENIINFIKSLIRYENKNITFKQLYEINQQKVSFITSNLTKKTCEILNYETYPDMPVYLGVLASISIPLIFPPVEFNNQLYIDGALYSPYYQDDLTDEDVILHVISKPRDINNIYTYISTIVNFITDTRAEKKNKHYYKLIIEKDISLFDISYDDIEYLLNLGKSNKIFI